MEYCDLIVNTLDSMCRGKPGDDDDFARCDFHIKRMGWSSRNLSEVNYAKLVSLIVLNFSGRFYGIV